MIAKILLTLMSIQLVLLPMELQLNIVSSAHASDKCSGGQHFDSVLNRCVLNKETVDSKVSVQSCDGLEGAAFKDCFDKNAKEQVSKLESEGKIKASKSPKASMMNYGVAAVAAIGAAYYLFISKEDVKQCGSTSLYLMLGGGVTTLLGEILAQTSYKKSVKKLGSDYKDRMTKSSTDKKENIDILTSNQVIAFDYQIDSEKARQKAHKSRATTYNLAFGLYTAAAVASLYEAYKFKDDAACKMSSEPKTSMRMNNSIDLISHHPNFSKYHYISNFSAQEVIEVIFREVTSVFPSAHAEEEKSPGEESSGKDAGIVSKVQMATNLVSATQSGSGDAVKNAAQVASKESGIGKTIAKAVRSPLMRAAASGILAFYSKGIASDAKRRAKDSKERVKMIENLKTSFLNNGGSGFASCSNDDRTNPEKTSCYCYLEDGSKNPARETSNVCLEVFGQVANTTATDYDQSGPFNPNEFKGCFTKQKRVDLNCKCKGDAKSGKKDNCLNISPEINIGQLASNKSLTTAATKAQSFTSGNISTGQIGTDTGVKLALSMNKIKKKLDSNPKTAKLAKKAKKYESVLKKRIENGVQRAIAKNPAIAKIGSSLGSDSDNISAKDALKAMNKDLKAKGPKFISGKSSGAITAKKDNEFDLDFGDSSNEGGALIDEEVAAVMKQKFKINDISENTHHNIFKIITNRYKTSAMRHLFDDSGTFEGEAANESEINEK